jgi:DNA polymerase III alpha subunit
MKTSNYGEIIYDENDLCNLIMQGHDAHNLPNLTVEPGLNIKRLASIIENPGAVLTWNFPQDNNASVSEFDQAQQAHWFMPELYKQLDIAEHVLSLCTTQEELQRCGHELLLFQERGLFDLLRYMKYLVDTMKANNVIWGVGRGSSVASYVLYKLEVHRVNSMYYDLDPGEFLR